MSPEKFHDALNYLDDDLIAQTDELRQGQRVLQTRPTARRVLTWLAPAACLALVLGLGPHLVPMMESADQVEYGNGQMNESAEQPNGLENYMTADGTGTARQDSLAAAWETYTCGDFSVAVPDQWGVELESGEDGSLFMLLRPPFEDGALRVGYQPNFGVCGTGLTQKDTVIAGMDAVMGYYDGSDQWSFIVFSGPGADYVALKDGADSWWGIYGDTAMEILETLEIAKGE